jgi:hypothetical protein
MSSLLLFLKVLNYLTKRKILFCSCWTATS